MKKSKQKKLTLQKKMHSLLQEIADKEMYFEIKDDEDRVLYSTKYYKHNALEESERIDFKISGIMFSEKYTDDTILFLELFKTLYEYSSLPNYFQ